MSIKDDIVHVTFSRTDRIVSAMRDKAAVIRIRESKAEESAAGIEVPGLFAYFIDQLSRIPINILDVISTRSTLTLLIAEEDLMQAYSALSYCIQHFRKRDGQPNC
jgi:hypothetical protein